MVQFSISQVKMKSHTERVIEGEEGMQVGGKGKEGR
jgi:hypothetical protein